MWRLELVAITEHKMNVDMSKELYISCSNHIEKKQCYNNVWNAINFSGYGSKFVSGEWKVAYGYVSVLDDHGLMARHAFIIDEQGQAIDPTIVCLDHFNELNPREYVSFAILKFDEYLDILENNDLQPSLYMAFKDEEKQAWEWSKNNNKALCG
jgi:hypothetical protein